MKPARYVVLEESATDAFIFRYADDWQFSGDTWHATAEDALGPIEYEFGQSSLDWIPISEQELNALSGRGK